MRSGAFPRWFALTGYLLGGLLIVIVTIWDWVVLVLPAWVAVVSLFILRRERSDPDRRSRRRCVAAIVVTPRPERDEIPDLRRPTHEAWW